MNFGDSENSLCGICGDEEDGFWKGDELVEDTICWSCSRKWVYDDESEEYKRKVEVDFLTCFFLYLHFLTFLFLCVGRTRTPL